MNIYLLENGDEIDYDTYDAAVVVAATIEEARLIHPNEHRKFKWNGTDWVDNDGLSAFPGSWCSPSKVTVTIVGTTGITYPEVILASYNAG